MTTIHEYENTKPNGSYTAERITQLVDDRMIKVVANYDASYPHQSHSQVYVWNGDEFTLVATGGPRTNEMAWPALAMYLARVAKVVSNERI